MTVKAVTRMAFTIAGNSGSLSKMICQMSRLPAKTVCTSVNFVLNNQMVTGTSTGQLVTWQGTSHSKIHEAHKGSLNCLYPVNTTQFYTCGADGVILSWTDAWVMQPVVDLKSHQIQPCGITALDISRTKLLVGTSGSAIL